MRHGPPANGERSVEAAPTVSVVIPTLNERANLEFVFAALPAGLFEVVLVDGRSTDGTVEEARRLMPGVRVVHQTGRGKGNALACGFHACRGDIIVMIDADCSTDPQEIPAFVDALLGGADFAKGSRFVVGGGSDDITSLRRHGNRALNGLVNVMFRTRYTDLCYGYNAFWSRYLPVLDLDPGPRADPTTMQWGDGFEIETLINIRVARAGLRISEVPSFESARVFGVSNLNAVSDGLRVLRTVMTEFRRPRPAVATGTAPPELIEVVPPPVEHAEVSLTPDHEAPAAVERSSS
ncbi:glycosyltransferase family 2 protein [Pseudonocardia hydrocarbonoxydans]|uniref:Glycosyltransferase 2-like domain-containing protein n=1 Tax=Pseudonocardia hydrocarbonoxydans TaxID=76726 RepID=A0A4Y3WLI7_9PSEU|nr:glycosyltransferase family 2 protein [Pseudonocardia hydrocarbonoxydans]GEC19121.1 hypothetical protein PHY01_14040 [Pseudonocardia hydrocarbonoxydans]